MVSTAVESLQSAKAQLLAKISGLENEVKQIDAVVAALETLNGGDAVVPTPVVASTGTDARLAALAKARAARWGKVKQVEAPVAQPAKKKRTMSAAARKAIGAAVAARWAKVRAAKAKAAKKK